MATVTKLDEVRSPNLWCKLQTARSLKFVEWLVDDFTHWFFIRSAFNKGNITLADLLSTFPFQVSIVKTIAWAKFQSSSLHNKSQLFPFQVCIIPIKTIIITNHNSPPLQVNTITIKTVTIRKPWNQSEYFAEHVWRIHATWEWPQACPWAQCLPHGLQGDLILQAPQHFLTKRSSCPSTT